MTKLLSIVFSHLIWPFKRMIFFQANIIKEWPDILALQLKRFEVAVSLTGVYYRKNEYKVYIPSDIEVRKYLQQN